MNPTMMQVLLAVTFVFGVLHLLTLTKLFDSKLVGILFAVFFEPTGKNVKGLHLFMSWINYVFFYFSLAFQAWYWLFKPN